MKTCQGCKYAAWKRTASGRLHPDKSGRCTKEVKIPALPACQSWLGCGPKASFPYIERGVYFETHCPYYKEDR